VSTHRTYLENMSFTEDIQTALKAAMKSGDRVRVSALRLVLSELQKAAKEGRDDELGVLRRERNRRLEAADIYTKAGREELAAPELAEAALIESFLPAEISDAELDGLVAAAIAGSGATTIKDMGAVMKTVMAAVGDRADGKRVSARVRNRLS
jgi:hypothetical protein